MNKILIDMGQIKSPSYFYNGEIKLTGRIWPSVVTPYIEIGDPNHYFYYDIVYSTEADNLFYVGIERYDEDKAATSNSSCTYQVATQALLEHKHACGQINLKGNLSTGKPVKYIRLRVLNDWGTANNRQGIIHSLLYRESDVALNNMININHAGEVMANTFVENYNKTSFSNSSIVFSKSFYEY